MRALNIAPEQNRFLWLALPRIWKQSPVLI